jgi:flagellar hook-length control protein FliK
MAVVAGTAAAAVRPAPASTDVAATALPPAAAGAVTKAAAPAVDVAAGTARAPVAEQIHRAVEVHAEVVRSEGRVEFHLHLDPPELGSVRVHLTLTDQTLTARLVVHDAAARQLVEGQLEALRQRLLDMGLNLGRLDVTGDGSPRGEGGAHRQSLPYPFAESGGPGEGTGSTATPAAGPVRSSATRIDVMV